MNSTTATRREMTAGRAYLLAAVAAAALAALIVGAGILLGSRGGPALSTCPQGQVKAGSVLGAPECTYQP